MVAFGYQYWMFNFQKNRFLRFNVDITGEPSISGYKPFLLIIKLHAECWCSFNTLIYKSEAVSLAPLTGLRINTWKN